MTYLSAFFLPPYSHSEVLVPSFTSILINIEVMVESSFAYMPYPTLSFSRTTRVVSRIFTFLRLAYKRHSARTSPALWNPSGSCFREAFSPQQDSWISKVSLCFHTGTNTTNQCILEMIYILSMGRGKF